MSGGGMSGLIRTVVADSAQLAPGDAETLRAKVEAADLFNRSSDTAGGDQPDRPTYKITVEDEGRDHQVLLSDAAASDADRALIEFVESVPGHEDRLGRPG